MTAILATFSDLRLVKGRKIAQLVFEIPIERAKAAVDVLGIPDPTHEAWVGIARVDNVKLNSPGEKAAGAALDAVPASKPNSTRAVMLAKDPEFQRFVGAAGEAEADAEIKRHCGVTSKTELNQPGQAAQKFADLRHDFREWRQQ